MPIVSIPIIQAALEGVELSLPQTLQTASAAIEKRFTAGEIPIEIAEAIREGYAALRQT